MPALFKPLQLREINLRNRIAVSPMCMYSSVDGFANDWHLAHLGSRAVGGAGLVMTEATAVSPEGRISFRDLGIWKDEQIKPLRAVTKFIEDHGSVPGIQLAHAGRKGSRNAPWEGDRHVTDGDGGFALVSSTGTPFSDGYGIPSKLDENGIKKVVDDFRAAAQRALEAGFKVAEIHGAHGYLVHQFLSPLCNDRKDAYGGSFENRIRLLLEIVKEVRGIWPDELPLLVRISSTDWHPEGWTIEESVKLSSILKTLGVDLIDVSSGGIAPGIKIPVGPGYQVPFADQVKRETGILTGAVGLITEPKQADEIIASGKADIVLLAREMLRDPYFPLRAAKELGAEVTWPVQYLRARR
jgi:2,4-dienoyl-CoA reductase-like NADH-dependent reductase (Old Yellow Enzyme family)